MAVSHLLLLTPSVSSQLFSPSASSQPWRSSMALTAWSINMEPSLKMYQQGTGQRSSTHYWISRSKLGTYRSMGLDRLHPRLVVCLIDDIAMQVTVVFENLWQTIFNKRQRELHVDQYNLISSRKGSPHRSLCPVYKGQDNDGHGSTKRKQFLTSSGNHC